MTTMDEEEHFIGDIIEEEESVGASNDQEKESNEPQHRDFSKMIKVKTPLNSPTLERRYSFRNHEGPKGAYGPRISRAPRKSLPCLDLKISTPRKWSYQTPTGSPDYKVADSKKSAFPFSLPAVGHPFLARKMRYHDVDRLKAEERFARRNSDSLLSSGNYRVHGHSHLDGHISDEKRRISQIIDRHRLKERLLWGDIRRKASISTLSNQDEISKLFQRPWVDTDEETKL